MDYLIETQTEVGTEGGCVEIGVPIPLRVPHTGPCSNLTRTDGTSNELLKLFRLSNRQTKTPTLRLHIHKLHIKTVGVDFPAHVVVHGSTPSSL